MIELERLNKGEKLKERMDSLSINKTVAFGDTTILFVAFTEGGKKKHACESFRKDKDSGLWAPEYLSTYEVEKTDPGLAKQMKDWGNDD